MKPALLRGALPGKAMSGLYLLGVLNAFKAATMVAFAGGLAAASLELIHGQNASGNLLLAAVAAVLRGLAVWAVAVLAQRIALGAKEALRAELVERWMDDGGAEPAAAVLATRGLDALDGYYTQFLPALVSAATVPLILGLRILSADWVSALIVLLTVPLIPLFMALIGWHIQQKVSEASGALLRLSHHLAELARGLPVLIGVGRAAEQRAALRELGQEYRSRTMLTLRTAFLSALALELAATLSVAVVAVFIGVRLVYGQLGLETGLLVLILVADCYLPLREVGTAFHASDDGREAMRRARLVLDAERGRGVLSTEQSHPGGGVQVSGLSVHYPQRRGAAISELNLSVEPGTICAVSGPSGCGKSTLLAALAGQLTSNQAELSGTVSGIDPDRLSWLSQQPGSTETTVAAELQLWGAEQPTVLLDAVGLSGREGQHPASLSPGQLRRLALARVLARVESGAQVVLLDEPTAHVDAESARWIEQAVLSLRSRATVLLASHDRRLLALADQHLELELTK
ncbi:ATP-binding cassette subfamily C protein CydCD [Psychromicrobium silvestre]|uniref:ATP-binding cassette subfamily C protein CydCD n=1 Tax=Psychromicrobium silvestre TaxID=1645614 RepID=A0A7Y9S3U2_9MICC|nr:ATP-binding cassette domain-containing protein [Psychromicrobium silvestre]NYE94039.1 ATP-binding cassette subfamily C protein CydCD [Psychromicrobium silvestre]